MFMRVTSLIAAPEVIRTWPGRSWCGEVLLSSRSCWSRACWVGGLTWS